jgi:hypothetical protein
MNSFILLVDNNDIRDLIVGAASAKGFQWQESANLTVCLEELHRSIDRNGEFPIFLGSHCLMNDFKDPMDVNLSPIRAEISNGIVKWYLEILDGGSASAALTFQFHQPQLSSAVQALPTYTVIE